MIHSASPDVRRFGLVDADFSARFATLWAMWPSRSLAFGVGPRPSRPRFTRPPEPAVGLPLPVFLIAPRREELPAIRVLPGDGLDKLDHPIRSQRPRRALRGFLELDARGLQLVADRVSGGEVLGGPGRGAL